MDQIEDLEKVVNDLKKQSSDLKTCTILKSKDFEENYAMKLSTSQEEFSDLKFGYTRTETNVLLLECLAKDPKDWPTSKQVEEQLKQLKSERKRDKTAIKEEEDAINTLSEELQIKNKELQGVMSSLVEKLEKVKTKKNEYEELKRKSEEILNTMKEKETLTTDLKDMEEKLTQSNYAIQQCNTSISSLEHYITMLQGDIELYRNNVNEMKENLISDEEQKRCKGEEMSGRINWLKTAADLLKSLGGISIKEVHDDALVLQIHNSKPLTDNNNEQQPLLLTLKFKLCALKSCLCGAEINLPSLNIEDLVKVAIDTGDVATFVADVKKRCQYHNALQDKIDELHKNYAVDWDPSLGQLRVMLGKSGKTVCTLGVTSSYPAPDSLSLINVESKDQEVNLDDLKPKSCTSMSDWIKHLYKIFNGM